MWGKYGWEVVFHICVGDTLGRYPSTNEKKINRTYSPSGDACHYCFVSVLESLCKLLNDCIIS